AQRPGRVRPASCRAGPVLVIRGAPSPSASTASSTGYLVGSAARLRFRHTVVSLGQSRDRKRAISDLLCTSQPGSRPGRQRRGSLEPSVVAVWSPLRCELSAVEFARTSRWLVHLAKGLVAARSGDSAWSDLVCGDLYYAVLRVVQACRLLAPGIS